MTENGRHLIPVPLFGLLGSLSFSNHKNIDYYDTNTLFWSLTRLFGYYDRILPVLSEEHDNRPFLDSDIESFIIRFRIVLNDLAYIIWQFFPENSRGLKGPRGNTHPRNREVSVFNVMDFLKKEPANFPELGGAFLINKEWINRLKAQRDNVVHYKSKVVVFSGQPLTFAMLNAAGTQKHEITETGGLRISTQPVFEFVNGQMCFLHKFMHTDLYNAIERYAKRIGLKCQQFGSNPRMGCNGVELFMRTNQLTS